MELVNDFTVNVPVNEAWVTLTDVERIAPCLPGAQLQEVEGDVYRGVVKVKVGPILAQFKGQATFVEKDDTNHRAVLKAEGRDTSGKGNASALITAKLEPEGDKATKVTVSTDLTITGRVAQFGRGALADVSTKLLGQFVTQLESTVLNDQGASSSGNGTGAATTGTTGAEGAAAAGASPSAPTTAVGDASSAAAAGAATAPTAAPPDSGPVTAPSEGGVRRVDHAEAQPIDLIDAAGAPIAKRLIPVLAAVLVVLLLVRWRRHR
jgi:carbon monoxide dehydrogenase subunit G